MEFKDYYKVLGVAADATRDEIRRAYRKLARRFHPDVSEEADAEERFKEVSEAWDILGDEEKRATYDDLKRGGGSGAFGGFGAPGSGAPGSGAPGSGGPGFGGPGFGGAGFAGAEGAGFADAFNDLFSSMRAGGFTGGDPFASFGGAGQTRQAPPQDATAALSITPAEAFEGVERALRIAVTDANGRPREKTLKVRIPAGVATGSRIRLRGQGPADRSGRNGDLYVEITLAKDPRFEIDGRDVRSEVAIPAPTAALGGTVRVDTLGGAVDVRVPVGAERPLRLRGRGLPAERDGDSGDHYVRFRITVPSSPTDEERALYEALAELSAATP